MLNTDSIRSENYNGQGSTPCLVCGKPVKNPVYFLHVVDGGASIIKPDETWDNEAADLGLYPLGADCKKKHPELDEYVIVRKPMSMTEIAREIGKYLAKFEADPKISRVTTSSGQLITYFWNSHASASGRWIYVTYISYQGGRNLSKKEALEYLEWLRAGNVGRHYEAWSRKS